MDDVVTAQLENEHLRKIRSRLMQWDVANKALAPLEEDHMELLDLIDATINPKHVSEDTVQGSQQKVCLHTHNYCV